jgi:hypothetical protein
MLYVRCRTQRELFLDYGISILSPPASEKESRLRATAHIRRREFPLLIYRVQIEQSRVTKSFWATHESLRGVARHSAPRGQTRLSGESADSGRFTLEHTVNRHSATPTVMDKDPLTVDVPREFHRRMALIIDAVQTGIWQGGVHDLLGYATDYAFGQERGLQTLVLKSKHRSAYVRLHWDTLMSDAVGDRQLVDELIQNAIRELR